jgi:uncharacterized membrane protein YfcA
MPLEPLEYLLITLAAMAAGAVNALAGGGTLISFPVLTAAGIPAVAANITNTVALSPGYLGATLAQRAEILDQRRRLWFLLPAAALGGLAGGLLLLNTSERLFRQLVPFLILAASLLLAAQEPLRRWLTKRASSSTIDPSQSIPAGTPAAPPLTPAPLPPGSPAPLSPRSPAPREAWAAIPIFFAAIYGGYFGAGLSVIILAVLALALEDSLTRLNALKQAVAFVTNLTAAAFFLFSGQVVWSAAAVMAVGALIGGALGGRLAGRVRPATLRRVVVVIGIAVSIIYFIRG